MKTNPEKVRYKRQKYKRQKVSKSRQNPIAASLVEFF